MKKIQCVDHLGNIYKTKTERAKAYNLSVTTIDNRLKKGATLEMALTLPAGTPFHKVWDDHKGNIFATKADLCAHYGITEIMYSYRENLGWSKKDILETPKMDHVNLTTDHEGNEYKNEREMCRIKKINYYTYKGRKRRGKDTKKALSEKIRKRHDGSCQDHLGKEYPSEKARAEAWGISYSTYFKRKERGLSLKETLETPLRVADGSKEKIYKDNGISKSLYYRKLNQGWNEEEIIRVPEITKIRTNGAHLYGNMILHYSLCENGVPYFECECKICGSKAILTPEHIVEHIVEHQNYC